MHNQVKTDAEVDESSSLFIVRLKLDSRAPHYSRAPHQFEKPS